MTPSEAITLCHRLTKWHGDTESIESVRERAEALARWLKRYPYVSTGQYRWLTDMVGNMERQCQSSSAH